MGLEVVAEAYSYHLLRRGVHLLGPVGWLRQQGGRANKKRYVSALHVNQADWWEPPVQAFHMRFIFASGTSNFGVRFMCPSPRLGSACEGEFTKTADHTNLNKAC